MRAWEDGDGGAGAVATARGREREALGWGVGLSDMKVVGLIILGIVCWVGKFLKCGNSNPLPFIWNDRPMMRYPPIGRSVMTSPKQSPVTRISWLVKDEAHLCPMHACG